MKHHILPASLLLALSAWTLPAHAIGRLADITVVDRNTGATLPLYYHRGEYWVAGQYGAKYAIAVRNKLGERLLAVTAVDGVNVLSGETAAWDQTGYVFSSWQQYQVTGWRKSSSEVAAFEFSALGDSYAGRTGRPANVGVIGVALFREQPPEPVAQAPVYSSPRRSEREADAPAAPAPPAAESPAAGKSALADRILGGAEASASAEGLLRKPQAAPLPAPKLGTGHGARESSLVSHTSFARLQSQPNEVIRIRYDSRENLVANGVIREPVAHHPVPDPFPQSGITSYVPDPPLRRY
ncbi:hypothetical protein [Polaromonas sp. JS666]|uniref:hypothetical protein n=1 Tax=Polaromonas sp. (strain JS666 / ATCC BAA-500) TaxID=296591 RepID=UPI00088B1F4F|nr:hypothetical protein [Polaromonas sp. JS666]SDM76487.1 hypothetical protein SAMN05720382_102255 [Polaromonas sp. JS666]